MKRFILRGVNPMNPQSPCDMVIEAKTCKEACRVVYDRFHPTDPEEPVCSILNQWGFVTIRIYGQLYKLSEA